MKANNPMLVIFEGVDKSGKTTLKTLFNAETNFSYVVLDRLTTSSKIYNKLFNRGREEYYEEFDSAIYKYFNVLTVLCVAECDEIKERLESSQEVLPKELEDIENIQQMFVEQTKGIENLLVLNTSKMNKKECVSLIVKKVREMDV